MRLDWFSVTPPQIEGYSNGQLTNDTNCTNCHTPLQLLLGARSIRCAICGALNRITDSSSASRGHAPSPPVPPAPPTSKKKKAVICGISYRYSKHELKGSIADAKSMFYLLINKFSFPVNSILMLTEEENDPYRLPTKHNIRMAMHWLLAGCQPGDSLVFHYSGHGSHVRNHNSDRIVGYDETLCPLDFETRGAIVDEEINATLVRPLPTGVKLHAILDACHSETVMDLPFLCRMNRDGQYIWEDHRPRSGTWKGSRGGEVFSFSRCDDQTCAGSIKDTDTMTFYFIQAIERGLSTTYGSMLNFMRSALRNARNDNGGGVVTSVLTRLLTSGRLRQEPELTTNEPFDVYRKPFSL